MPISPEDFEDALMVALASDKVMKKIKNIAEVKELEQKIERLKEDLRLKDNKILVLENKIKTLEDDTVPKLIDDVDSLLESTDDLEQYSRRNSLRISGLKQMQYEDPVQVALAFCNFRLGLKPALTVHDIDRAHRVGRVDRANPN